MHNHYDWTDSALRLLTEQWNAGVPTVVIGRRLGITKNVVIGKAHRLGLPARKSPIKRDPDEPAPPRHNAAPPKPKPAPPPPSSRTFLFGAALDRRRAVPEVARTGQQPGVAAPAPAPRPSVPYLRVHACQWPTDAEPGAWPRFRLDCQAPLARGAYCAEHAALAYLDRRALVTPE